MSFRRCQRRREGKGHMTTAVKIFDQPAQQDQSQAQETASVSPPAVATVSAALLIDARTFAQLLAVSLATFNRMKAAGKLPKPIELSRGCHRWRLAEVRDWIDAGCPPIKEWQARRKADSRR